MNKIKTLLLLIALFCSSAAFGADTVALSCEVAGGGNLTPGEQAQINIYASTSQAVDIYGLDFKIKSSDLTLVASSGTDAKVSASSEFSDMTVAGHVNTGRFILFSMAQTPVTINGKTLVCTVTVNVSESARKSATVTLDECYYTRDKDGMNTPAIGPFTSILTVNPPAPKSITVSAPGNITEYQSYDKVQLSASFNPEDADPSVTWTSGDTRFAEIDENGLVTVKAIGIGNQPVVTFTATSTANTSISGSIELTFKPIIPTDMTVTPATANIIIGDTQTFSVSFQPDNAESKEFDAVIADEAVAAITDITDGTITVSALKVGTTTLRVTCSQNSDLVKEISITVSPRLVSKIEVSADKTSIEVGQTAKLTATVSPDNATDKSFTWSSSDNAVATVNADGVVTGVKVGTVTISATANDGSGVKGSVTINVVPTLWTSLSVDVKSFSFVKGESFTAKVSGTPANATDKSLSVTSSNDNVATGSYDPATGIVTVTATGEGSAVITVATNDGSNLSAKINVNVADRLTITATDEAGNEVTEVVIESTVTLTANTDSKVTWNLGSGLNKISEDGSSIVVEAIATGVYPVTVTASNNISATVEITVTPPPFINATGINLNFTDVTLSFPGGMIQLEATVSPDDCDNDPVTWASENSAVATVNANGFVTATGLGVTFIYATTVNNDGTEMQAFCKVTVIDASSGIDATQANEPVITLTPMTINVSGIADDCKVSVYTLTGQLIAAETGRCSVPVANRGIYIVKIGSKAVKVSVTR